MKNTRALLMLVFAVVAGLAAVILASRWLLDRSAAGSKIIVAAADVNLGQPLNTQLLKLVDWPADSMPAGSFTDLKTLEGRVLKTSISRGEPIMEAKLAPVGTKGGLSAVISEGKRAITVRVNDVIGVAGFALPGNYVDIIVSTQKEGGGAHDKSQSISKIVLDRILVLAVAQEVNRDETKPKVVNAVTLEVTPQQAEKLDLARSVGTLSLALRNQIDPQPGATSGATKVTLLGEIQPASASKPVVKPVKAQLAKAPAKTCVGVINGLHGMQECY
ncbi:Flp pilus assembly protein CpaB [Oxalobacteraceae bacterium R-40]|uniref:Flp pilus assembly protein CpaB n=1 Tax=Keguizhuia sedimenti TaxID=3064264 RepID=A0ABU1BIT1_9BURK|nr:Flp pilus assembly protein CpaB [Oxalobacteraceae bacterium R-40]